MVHGEPIEGLGGYSPRCRRKIALGECVFCMLEISEEDSRHTMGTVPAQGLFCVGWTGRLMQWGAWVTEWLIHVAHKPHFFSLSFPQSPLSRGIRGVVGGYEVLHAPHVTLLLSPLTSFTGLICKRELRVLSGSLRKHIL